MKIYLTRHSKTVWNQEKRLQGHCDSALTQEGIENAKALKEYIQDIHFDYIFSSPIQRAYQTASLLFRECDIIQDDRIMEMNFGVFEGRKISDILETDYELYHCLWHHPEQFTRIPEGESYDEVVMRAQLFLDDLKKLPQESTIIVVTHGMFFIVLLATMLKIDRKDYVQFNQKVVEGCSLTRLSYRDNVFSLDYYNQNDYLPHVSNTSFTK